MSTKVVVELTSDEEKLLAGFRKAGAADEKMRSKLKMSGTAGEKAGNQIRDAMVKAGMESTKSVDQLIGRLRRTGNEGRTMAAAIDESLRKSGSSGKQSFDQVLNRIKQLSPEAAIAADQAAKSMADADFQSTFMKTVNSLHGLSPAAQQAAKQITEEFQKSDAAAQFTKSITELESLGDTGAEQAKRIRVAMAKADADTEFDSALKQLESLGGEAQEVGRMLKDEMKDSSESSTQSMESILAKIREMKPEAGEAADRIVKEISDASTQSKKKLDSLIKKLGELGPQGASVAKKLRENMEKASNASENSIEGIIDKIDDINPTVARNAKSIHREVEKNASRAGVSMQKFTSQARTQILSMVGAYASVQGAIQKIVELNKKVIETNKQALESLKQNQGGDRRLLQVATDGKDFQRLRGKADSLSIVHGVDRDAARALMFSARSENFESSVDFIGKNQQIIDTESQARVAGQVPQLFPAEKLTPEQTIEGTFAAAKLSRLNFEDVATALPSASEGASLSGATSSEVLAATSVLASRFKSGDVAADRIKAFTTKVGLDQGGEDRDSLKGLGLIGSVKKLQSMTPENRRDFLKENEQVNQGYSILVEEMATIQRRQGKIEAAMKSAGTSSSPTAKARAVAQSDPRMRATLRSKISEMELEIKREKKRAIPESNRQRSRNNALGELEDSGASPVRIAAAEMAADFGEGFGQTNAGGFVSAVGGNQLSNLMRDLQLANRTDDASAAPALLAVSELRKARRKDPNAMVPADAVAMYMTQATGEQYTFNQITPKMQGALTKSIDSRAETSQGYDRSMVVSFLDTLGGYGLGPAKSDGIESSQAINKTMMQLLERQTMAIEKQNQILERQAESAEKSAESNATTATNTQPRPRNNAEVQRNAVNGGQR